MPSSRKQDSPAILHSTPLRSQAELPATPENEISSSSEGYGESMPEIGSETVSLFLGTFRKISANSSLYQDFPAKTAKEMPWWSHGGIYTGLMELANVSRSELKPPKPFWMNIVSTLDEEGARIEWFSWKPEREGAGARELFHSPFAPSDPMKGFWRLPQSVFVNDEFEAGECKEILIVPVVVRGKEKFNPNLARAYCRNEVTQKGPLIGTMVFESLVPQR